MHLFINQFNYICIRICTRVCTMNNAILICKWCSILAKKLPHLYPPLPYFRVVVIGDIALLLNSLSMCVPILMIALTSPRSNPVLNSECTQMIPSMFIGGSIIITTLLPSVLRCRRFATVLVVFVIYNATILFYGIRVGVHKQSYGFMTFTFVVELCVLLMNEQHYWKSYMVYVERSTFLREKYASEYSRKLLEVRSQELRHLIGNMAHDLKSPLQAFLFEIDNLKELKEDPQKTAESVVFLKTLCSFMSMMINRGIDYTKISSGVKLVPSMSTFHMRKTIQWVQKCVHLSSQDVPIKLEIDQLLCTFVVSDEHWLLENLLCLVSNAQKFTTSGEIVIRCYPEKSNVSVNNTDNTMIRIEIEDSGIGIAPEKLQTLFKPFSQAQRCAGGTGLGLFSLSKRVESLGGACGVESHHCVKQTTGVSGSKFWFTIPYRPDRNAELAEVGCQQPCTTNTTTAATTTTATNNKTDLFKMHFEHLTTNRRILVADDSTLIRKTTKKALEKAGFQVDAASNGLETLQLIEKNSVDAYICILMVR